jgi:excinuclease ABC subunit B
VYERDYYTVEVEAPAEETFASAEARADRVAALETEMKEAARRLDFERAAELRDKIRSLRRAQIA